MDVDTKERLKIIMIFLLQSYKVAMGSMLVLFVPQECGNNSVCSLNDNLTKTVLAYKPNLIILGHAD